jgi:hypothetical protein
MLAGRGGSDLAAAAGRAAQRYDDATRATAMPCWIHSPSWYALSFQTVHVRVRTCFRLTASQEDACGRHGSHTPVELMISRLVYAGHLVLLCWWSMLNYAALAKILKKHGTYEAHV